MDEHNTYTFTLPDLQEIARVVTGGQEPSGDLADFLAMCKVRSDEYDRSVAERRTRILEDQLKKEQEDERRSI